MRKLPLEHFSVQLRHKLSGQSVPKQREILANHIDDIRKQLAKENKRKYSPPILRSKTNAETILKIHERWKDRELFKLAEEGKHPTNPHDFHVASHGKPLRKIFVSKEEEHSKVSATEVALRFVTPEIMAPYIRKKFQPKVIRVVEQLLTARERHLPGVQNQLSAPYPALVVKAINATGSGKEGVRIINHLSKRVIQIKNEAKKSYPKHKSDAFFNIANTFGFLVSVTEYKLGAKQEILNDALEIIEERKEALKKLQSSPEANKYKSSANYLKHEIDDYANQATIFAHTYDLHLHHKH